MNLFVELLENVFWMEFCLTAFITGILGGHMKLYDKNSWMYKESQEEEWIYNTNSRHTWGVIISMTITGGGGIFIFSERIILLLLEILDKY